MVTGHHHVLHVTMKIVDTLELAAEINRPVRQVRTLVYEGKIPVMKISHKGNWFDLDEVVRALKRFEIPAVSAKNGKR